MRGHEGFDEVDAVDRVSVIRELKGLADTTDPGWALERRRRRWVPQSLPSIRGRVASCAAVAVTISLGAALWSSAPAAGNTPVLATPATGGQSAGAAAGSWLVSTGRSVNEFSCQQEYLRTVSAANSTGVPPRATFVTDCVRAAGRARV